MTYENWLSRARKFRPDDAEAMFGFQWTRDDVRYVWVYPCSDEEAMHIEESYDGTFRVRHRLFRSLTEAETWAYHTVVRHAA